MSLRIMIVEDDVDLRECLAESLQKHGYEVSLAVSAVEAIHRLRDGETVDLILSDYLMRNGDGLELLEFVRRQHPENPPFFLITGQSQVNPEQARLLGAQEFILKPFSFPTLLAKIADYLRVSSDDSSRGSDEMDGIS